MNYPGTIPVSTVYCRGDPHVSPDHVVLVAGENRRGALVEAAVLCSGDRLARQRKNGEDGRECGDSGQHLGSQLRRRDVAADEPRCMFTIPLIDP